MIPVLLLAVFVQFSGCKKVYVPKPRGYYKIEFPEKSYQKSTLKLPYQFEYPDYAKLEPDTLGFAEPYWVNIDIPLNKAKIHLSYKPLTGNLQALSEESRELVYKHAIKAFAINETFYEDDTKKVYGILYEIKGNAASPMQFELTDSLHHFLRGSFYISEVPNYDSLKPVIDFLIKDIDRLVETFTWN